MKTINYIFSVTLNKTQISNQLYFLNNSKQNSDQGCKNPGCQVILVTGFFIVLPNICGSSVQDLRHVYLLLPRAFTKAPKFLEKFVHPWVKCAKGKKKKQLFRAETTSLD